MDPITLAIGGGLLLLALSKRRAAGGGEPSQQSSPSAPQQGTGGDGPKLPPLNAATLTIIKFGAEAAIAAEIGGQLTGDKGDDLVTAAVKGDFSNLNTGKVFSDAASVSTQLVNGGLGAYGMNIGRLTGREFDQLAGGDGQSGTGAVAQGGLGLTGYLATFASLGVTAAAFFYTALAYAIGSIVSDLNRLACGQKGAREDWEREWNKVQVDMSNVLRGLRPTGLTDEEWAELRAGKTPVPIDQAIRFSWPYADGYLIKSNQLAFKQWMKRGRGLLSLGTTDDAYHAQFGADRGYFVGSVAAGSLLNEPTPKSVTPAYYLAAAVAPDEVTSSPGKTFSGQYTEELIDNPEKFKSASVGPSMSGSASTCAIWKGEGKGQSDLLYRTTCMVTVKRPVYVNTTFLSDPNRIDYERAGRCDSNLAAYFKWMTEEPHGAFVNDAGHRTAGLAQGRFEGAPDDSIALGGIRTEVWSVNAEKTKLVFSTAARHYSPPKAPA